MFAEQNESLIGRSGSTEFYNTLQFESCVEVAQLELRLTMHTHCVVSQTNNRKLVFLKNMGNGSLQKEDFFL